MCTILILLVTVRVGASLQQLLDAFVYAPADVPDYSTIYWLDYSTTLRSLKNMLYDTLVRNACVLFFQKHADGDNKGVCARRYYSKFNVMAITR